LCLCIVPLYWGRILLLKCQSSKVLPLRYIYSTVGQ
jgi:hypothetical protein